MIGNRLNDGVKRGMHIERSKKWWLERALQEGDSEVGAGSEVLGVQELRELEKLAVEKVRPPHALPLSYFPSAILNQVCSETLTEITEEVEHLVKDMFFTMLTYKGIGLAAPQVGRNLRLFVVDVAWTQGIKYADPLVFINPVVVPMGSLSIEGPEGCLSFPGAKVTVTRHEKIHVQALGLDGKPFEMEATDLLARVIQHEYDHLDGVTINPHLSPMQRNLLRKGLKRASKAPKVPVTPQR